MWTSPYFEYIDACNWTSLTFWQYWKSFADLSFVTTSFDYINYAEANPGSRYLLLIQLNLSWIIDPYHFLVALKYKVEAVDVDVSSVQLNQIDVLILDEDWESGQHVVQSSRKPSITIKSLLLRRRAWLLRIERLK